MKTIFCLGAITFLIHYTSFAQPYYFRHYQVEDGLSNSTVYCSTQDSYGFIWFGTKDGLNRFDGYHFKLYHTGNNRNDSTINSDFIFNLFSDAAGLLWIGSEKGLFSYDATKERLATIETSLPNVYEITKDTSGKLWFISGNTLCRLDITTSAIRQFSASTYFSASSLCKAEDGNIWISGVDGFLYKYVSDQAGFKKYDVFEHSISPTSRMIQKIRCGDNRSLFIGTSSQGIKRFDLTTNTYKDILTYNADRTTIFVRDIMKNNDNEIWFATESGIFIYKIKEGKFINLRKKFLDPYSLTDNAVYSLNKDKEGGIWAGTFFGGVNYYSKEYATFQKYFPDNSTHAISGNAVREICGDGYGNLWIGTEDAGLNKLNKKTGLITHYKPTGEKGSIAYSNIHGLMVVENNLWIGTFEHGIDIMDVRTGKVIKHYNAGPGKNDLKSNFALCFLKHSSGNIYIGTAAGLHIYDNHNNFQKPAGFSDNVFISSMIEAHDKTIWAGTHGAGIFWYNPATGKKGQLLNKPGDTNSVTNNSINAVFEDSKNNIWLATEGGGLCKLSANRQTISRYTTKKGLPGNYVFKVLEDDQHMLWVSTSKGLVKFDPDKEATVVYTKANGLLNDQFNYHSGFKDRDGKLYFGSVKGMISFNPENIIADTVTAPVYITGIQVQNKELNLTNNSAGNPNSIAFIRSISLPYYQSSISIDFAALSYISPGMTSYKYKMQGLENEWTWLPSNRKVYFTNLSPGNYVFKVKAAENNINWTTDKHITIIILPPFWNTKWAYFFYICVTLIIIYYLFKSYHKKHQTKKEKEIYKAKIDFFTNVAHEIRTPLTLIKGPVENLMELSDNLPLIREDVTTMDRNTNRLINLVSQILDFRQTEMKGFSLDFTLVNIGGVCKEMFLDFTSLARKKNLQYNLALPGYDIKTFADEEALRKIFSNLISNAIKYASKEVQIKIFIPGNSAGELIIEIENDGFLIPPEMKEKIFEPFYRLKETSKQKGTGIGLTLARSLVELHGGSLAVKDHKNKTNVFIVCLPLKQENMLIKTNALVTQHL